MGDMSVKIQGCSCRVCDTHASLILALTGVPRSVQTLLRADQVAEDRCTELYVYKCPVCDLAQLAEDPDTSELYSADYLCSVNFSPHAQDYQRTLAEHWARQHDLMGKQVLEVGGGDGFFAELLESHGNQITLLEPAPRACEAARERGLKRVVEGYLSPETFLGERFDAVVVRHVLEHMSKPLGFLTLLRERLTVGGKLFIEVPNLSAIVANKRFQDFYSEHLCYFDAQSLTYVLTRAGYELVQLYTIEKGDYIVCVATNPALSLERMLQDLEAFRGKVRALVQEARACGRRVGIWGAGGRGVALLALIHADNLGVAYVVDSDPKKWGAFTPVTHLPVVSPAIMHSEPVHDLLITATAFQEEIIRQLAWFPVGGRRLGVLQPEPRWLQDV
jgi:2-polyprenyl-3-methyl-5-hydroxy-6-metoxy-1,4-benzoquinol methylase